MSMLRPGQRREIIGFIMMGGSATIETEVHRNLPRHVEMATTRVPFRTVSYKGLLEMSDKIPQSAEILAEARPSIIAVTSFTGSCIRGQEMVNTIQQMTGIPAIVPSLEFARVLHLMNARRIAVVSCFEQELRMLEQIFFHNSGIEVVHFVEIAVRHGDNPFDFSQVDYEVIMKTLRQACFDDVDAIVVDLPVFVLEPELQAELEQFIHVPVLTMVQVLLWSTLDRLGEPTGNLYISKFLPQ